MDYLHAMAHYYRGEKIRSADWRKGYYISKNGNHLYKELEDCDYDELLQDMKGEWEIYDEPDKPIADIKALIKIVIQEILADAIAKINKLEL